MRRKFPILVAVSAIIASSVLSGCELMPVEAERPAIPIVNEYKGVEYEEVAVLRGDMELTKEIVCTFAPSRAMSHRFDPVYMEAPIAAVYVTVGQVVTEGILLAELDNTSLYSQINTQQKKIDSQNMTISHLKEDRDLDLKLQDALINQYNSQLSKTRQLIRQLEDWLAQENPTEPRPTDTSMDRLVKQEESLQQNLDKQKKNKTSVSDNYSIRLKNAEAALVILEQRLEELNAQLKSRQIFAAMTGLVTQADTVEKIPKVKNRSTVTITDMDSLGFLVKGDAEVAYLTEGMQTQMELDGKMYDLIVTKIIKASGTIDYDRAILEMVGQEIPALEADTKGTITLVLDSRQNVLYVESSVIQKNVNEYYVNVVGEDGLKIKKTVSVGLQCNGYTEITQGLEEGDLVIKG